MVMYVRIRDYSFLYLHSQECTTLRPLKRMKMGKFAESDSIVKIVYDMTIMIVLNIVIYDYA